MLALTQVAYNISTSASDRSKVENDITFSTVHGIHGLLNGEISQK